ncbi:MAG: hypothetical protein D6744_04885 [Planctomycetota bacterium]|nr:MAG: hypothetical protein D6744_04885 [Planctomycetota bacterium]
MSLKKQQAARHAMCRAGRMYRSIRLGMCLLPLLCAGCIVPQPKGAGDLSRIVEPTTKRGYWLYLSKPYVDAREAGKLRSRRWPLVVSFHGMKPFDNAYPQAREWEQEADRYGFVVVAPELRAPDVLGQFPLRTVTSALKSDENATMAILSHVFATTAADPQNVLATGWSSGGYMAHYMLNRHPERFTCLGVRQANFSASVLDPDLTRKGRDHPVFIVNTKNDFGICKKESREGVKWYESHGYRNVGWIVIDALGHERTPDVAAAFFARVSGVQPTGGAPVLAKRRAIDGNRMGIEMLSGNVAFHGRSETPSVASAARAARSRSAPSRNLPPPTAQPSAGGARSLAPQTPRSRSTARVTPPRPERRSSGLVVRRPSTSNRPVASPTPTRATAAIPARVPPRNPVNIRVSSAIGISPLHLGFSAECPAGWHNTADFLWTLDGEDVANGVNGQKTLSEPGVHTLGLLVVTRTGETYRTQRTIRVLPRLSNSTSARAANP